MAKKETKSTIANADLVAALNELFNGDSWEIPDDAIVGPFKRRIEQLEARVEHLTDELLKVSGKTPQEETDETPGRVDAMAAAVKKGSKKK